MLKRKPPVNRRNAPTPNARRESAPTAAPTNTPAPPRAPWRDRLHAWRDQHFYSLFSSLGRIAARRWATTLTVLVMGLALALPLLFFLVLDNARQWSGGIGEAREITAFLKPEVDARAAERFATELRGRADIERVEIRTPEQGLAEFKQLSGFAGALDVLRYNPLPSVLAIEPRLAGSEEPASIAVLQRDARVDLVQYDASWRRRLSAILGFGQRTVAVLASLLALATLLVVGNTVRLDIAGRAEEIAVMQLIGASDGFVRRPFLYAGLWYGLLAGLFAIGAILAVEFALAEPVARLTASYEQRFALHGIGVLPAVGVVVASAFLGWIGAFIASSRHLAAGRPQD